MASHIDKELSPKACFAFRNMHSARTKSETKTDKFITGPEFGDQNFFTGTEIWLSYIIYLTSYTS